MPLQHARRLCIPGGLTAGAHRRLPGRHRDRRVRPPGAARGAARCSCTVCSESLAGRAMIIGVDRLDYSKGLPQRLEPSSASSRSIRNGTARSPICRSRPRAARRSRNIPTWNAAISEAAGRINGAYGEADWTPIRYVNRAYSRTAWRVFTAARVGAGDAAARRHEPGGQGICRGPGSRKSRRAGPVALCRRGRRMPAALMVNPYDPEAVATRSRRRSRCRSKSGGSATTRYSG